MTGMHLKPEMRIIGIDDSPLVAKDVLVVGAVLRGGGWLDGLLSTHIEKDGTDATERLASMITESRNYGQLRVVMLNGVTFGGFNVVDIVELHRRTQLPVIVSRAGSPTWTASAGRWRTCRSLSCATKQFSRRAKSTKSGRNGAAARSTSSAKAWKKKMRPG